MSARGRTVLHELGWMRHVVSGHIGEALLAGPPDARRWAWNLHYAVKTHCQDLNDLVDEQIERLGGSPQQVWGEVGELVGGPEDTAATTDAPQTEDRLSAVLDVAARCSWEMSFHRDASVRLWARELTEWLDSAGANIDDRVEALSRRSGKGPTRFDLSGFSYDLTRQYVDQRGRRWEHTGDWTDAEVPVMRRDEPDGPAMTLPDLVRDRGPLFAICIPAHSTAGFSDEPPF